MTPLKFNSNSWHYFLYKRFTDSSPRRTDICRYSRILFFGMLWRTVSGLAGVYAALSVIVSACYIVSWGWVAYTQATRQLDALSYLLFTGFVVSLVACMVGSVVLLYFVWKALRRVRVTKYITDRMAFTPKRNSFVKEAWKSFKSKTCVPIEFDRD